MKAHRKAAPPRRRSRVPVLTLTQRVERLEREHFRRLEPARAAAKPAERFSVNGDVVNDRQTNLTWSRGNVGGKRLSWADAKKACEELKLAGHADWRLPTIQELLTLVDYSRTDPAIDKNAFACESAWYWTSTPYSASPSDCAWFVYFASGHSLWNSQDREYYVRAVRAGQIIGSLA